MQKVLFAFALFIAIVSQSFSAKSQVQTDTLTLSKTVNRERCRDGYALIDLPENVRLMVPLAPMGNYSYLGTDGLLKHETLKTVSKPDFCSIPLSERIGGQVVFFDLRQTRVSYDANCEHFLKTSGIQLEWHRRICSEAFGSSLETRLIDNAFPGFIRIHGKLNARHAQLFRDNQNPNAENTKSFRVVPSLSARSFNAYSLDPTLELRFICTRTSGGPKPIDAIFCTLSPKSDLSYGIGAVVLRSEIDKLIALLHASDAMIRESILRGETQ
ncbi:hypothetical protein [Mesorhizobium denitrificans]|uniref:hypothetical protein n=1 Tax=Mesorhizobium denitrificans TaxID=2294114 RepID=UPI0011C080CC|nr:hypothetical protein [Mesorhizobium denitrificans]